VHALTRGWRGGPIQCFGCQETGHVVTNCPHRAQGASALGTTLYVCELESSTPVYISLSFVNLCMFDLYRDMILFGGRSRLACIRRVFMLREIFAGVLPAHPAWM